MHNYDYLTSNFFRCVRKLVICLLIITFCVPITMTGKVQGATNPDDSLLPPLIGSGLSSPIAMDDDGPGFTTDEDHAFITPNVLNNDSDADGDRLFVSELDSSQTTGAVRMLSDYLDPSFGTGGKVITDFSDTDTANDLIVQPDRKIILVGSVWNPPVSSDFAVVRYNDDGSLDTDFGEDGLVTTDFGWIDIAFAVAYQPDEKIVVAGLGNYLGETTINVARYNPDGSLDDTFNTDGKARTPSLSVQDRSYMGIALQPDGKIVVAATCTTEGAYTILVVRFNPNGSLDTTFDGDGILILGIRNFTFGFDVVIQPDNKILISGYGNDYEIDVSGIVLARLNPDGSMDEGFGENGFVLTGFSINYVDMGMALALQPDNKIVVIGNTNESFALVRYNPDGSLDQSFDGDGIAFSDLIKGYDVAIQPDGKIDVLGRINLANLENNGVAYPYDWAVLRFNTDGSLDSEFGDSGLFLLHFDDGWGKAIAIGANGVLYVAGNVGSDIGLARISLSGTFYYDPHHRFGDLQDGEYATDAFRYTVSNGVLTDTATVTITIQGANELIYLPFVNVGWKIYGRVTENGIPAPGIPLELIFYNGMSWFTRATTTTDSDGKYIFLNMPDLAPGQEYYVLYLNTSNPNRLWLWGTRSVTHEDGHSPVNIGNFDISNIELISPEPGAVIVLPYLFQWRPRLASLNDSYEFDLYDPWDYDIYFYSNPLGYISSYYLSGYPPGFTNDNYYAWEVWAYSPDGGIGLSFYSYYVGFVLPNTMEVMAVPPSPIKRMPDPEIWRGR